VLLSPVARAQVSEMTERPSALNTSSTVCNYTRDLLKRW
jgi:hypothetical protein